MIWLFLTAWGLIGFAAFVKWFPREEEKDTHWLNKVTDLTAFLYLSLFGPLIWLILLLLLIAYLCLRFRDTLMISWWKKSKWFRKLVCLFVKEETMIKLVASKRKDNEITRNIKT